MGSRTERKEGGESETYKYIKGEKPADRIATAIFHMVIALIGVIVLGGLALMALIPWVLALLLLFVAALVLVPFCRPPANATSAPAVEAH